MSNTFLSSNFAKVHCNKTPFGLSNNKTLNSTRLVTAKAGEKEVGSYGNRRDLGAAAILLSGVFIASPAHALFGFGGNPDQEYAQRTGTVISLVRELLAIPKGDSGREKAVNSIRKESNDWVARYRRDDRYAGKPSYNNMYSVINALTGHFNSFGLEAPIPKKRLDRVVKEIDDAELFLSKGR